jgi:NAD(P)-dependent dehydrogenase (short-subunit alcohol dehydrogenase family)
VAAKVLILGGAGGIGGALAKTLVARGQPVHLAGRSEAPLARLAGELDASWSVCDVLDAAAVEAAVAEAAPGDEGLAGLAYAIGSIDLKPLRRAEFDDFMAAFALNVAAAARAIRLAQPRLADANGAVLLFSTVAVQQGFPSHAVIAAAKGGVEGLTRALAAELAPRIRVNAIAPSLTRTPLSARLVGSDTMARSLAALHPLARLGEAEDVAGLGALLLGPEAGWITGQVIGVDGGRGTLRLRD